MAEVLLFHHALGLTPGVHAFADELRGAGHLVHTPDLYDGRTYRRVDEGVIDAAREIVANAEDAELFLYPGDQHLFADSSLPSYDAGTAALVTGRVLEFLDRI